jgi:hypothetical protein
MKTPRLRRRPPPWLCRPRRTARLRFTAIYRGLFLLSGIALIAVTYGLFQQATRCTRPHLPTIPRTPAIQPVQLPHPGAGGFVAGAPSPKGVSQLPQDLSLLAEDNQRLSQIQQLLNQPPAQGNGPAGACRCRIWRPTSNSWPKTSISWPRL